MDGQVRPLFILIVIITLYAVRSTEDSPRGRRSEHGPREKRLTLQRMDLHSRSPSAD